jgi:hypothetical protein
MTARRAPIERTGPIAAFDALLNDIEKARKRGVDIGMREVDRIFRENSIAAWRHYRLYHYLGPRDGNAMPESALGWHGDPAVPHEPGAEQGDHGWYPTCSCGFRALLSSATEESAQRRASIHAQVSTPQPEGRYVLSAYDGPASLSYEPEVRLYCREHGTHALLRMTGAPDEHQGKISEAIRDHDWEFHEDDRRA